MGVGPVAVYSEADRHAPHVAQADEAVRIGPAPAAESYLNAGRDPRRRRAQPGAEAIHPGYGFLSENADFAEACERAGIVFIGPTPEQMRAFGLKHTAREIADARAACRCCPAPACSRRRRTRSREAERIGYPGDAEEHGRRRRHRHARLPRRRDELDEHFDAVRAPRRGKLRPGRRLSRAFVEHARHIEVQIFGDGRGNVVALGERDCSAQRRNQKVIEETPAPGLDAQMRATPVDTRRCGSDARVNYRSAGTVEFLYDADREEFYFLEVNTRLQVEHGVTEEVTGIDLVEWMVRLAAGELPPLDTLRLDAARRIDPGARLCRGSRARTFSRARAC